MTKTERRIMLECLQWIITNAVRSGVTVGRGALEANRLIAEIDELFEEMATEDGSELDAGQHELSWGDRTQVP